MFPSKFLDDPPCILNRWVLVYPASRTSSSSTTHHHVDPYKLMYSSYTYPILIPTLSVATQDILHKYRSWGVVYTEQKRVTRTIHLELRIRERSGHCSRLRPRRIVQCTKPLANDSHNVNTAVSGSVSLLEACRLQGRLPVPACGVCIPRTPPGNGR
jgi:hypothetical protein